MSATRFDILFLLLQRSVEADSTPVRSRFPLSSKRRIIKELSLPSRTLPAALFVAVLSTWITPFQRDLFIGDETKYAEVIREMRAAGAFFLPILNGVPFTHKPPLHFWMIDLLTFTPGVYSMWAFVLPSLIAFLFLIWLVWRMGGPMAAFIVATSLMMWAPAQTARMDISFT